ncbi:MAG: hypothetical protein Q9214_001598 [Letrouitia sp. 1 TL-2023]
MNSPTSQSHEQALAASQHAAEHLQKHAPTGTLLQAPFSSQPASLDLWSSYETYLFSCLKTGDDKAAHLCLEKLVNRFGANNERVMGLHGIYQEAMAEGEPALERILQEYCDILAEDPTNIPIIKRRVVLLRGLSRTNDAIEALVGLLGASPTDIEAWAELSDLYMSQRMFPQAAFCQEEILLVAPNAWNTHARLGEILYISAASTSDPAPMLTESVRRFCRSIELCDGYIRGYYGLKVRFGDVDLGQKAATRLREELAGNRKSAQGSGGSSEKEELLILPVQTVDKLCAKAELVLTDFLRQAKKNETRSSEISAVMELLKANQSG